MLLAHRKGISLMPKGKQGRHQDILRASNTRGRDTRETGETVTLMEELYSSFLADIDYMCSF